MNALQNSVRYIFVLSPPLRYVFETSLPACDKPKQFILRFLIVEIQGNVRGLRGMWGRSNIRKRENESAQSVASASKN